MIEIIQSYRLELVTSIPILIAAIWLWQSLREKSAVEQVPQCAEQACQLAYEYLVWKLHGNIALADQLIEIERSKSGCTLKEAIAQISREIKEAE